MQTHMVMINESDGYIPIEEKLRKLSRKKNISVSAILDCCRNNIESKSQVDMNKPDCGQLSILFGCKSGSVSTIANGVSKFTRDYIEHFENPQIQARPFPNIAILGFKPISLYGEHVNNTAKCYRIYES